MTDLEKVHLYLKDKNISAEIQVKQDQQTLRMPIAEDIYLGVWKAAGENEHMHVAHVVSSSGIRFIEELVWANYKPFNLEFESPKQFSDKLLLYSSGFKDQLRMDIEFVVSTLEGYLTQLEERLGNDE